jgi:hypothetical protein
VEKDEVRVSPKVVSHRHRSPVVTCQPVHGAGSARLDQITPNNTPSQAQAAAEKKEKKRKAEARKEAAFPPSRLLNLSPPPPSRGTRSPPLYSAGDPERRNRHKERERRDWERKTGRGAEAGDGHARPRRRAAGCQSGGDARGCSFPFF